MKGFIKVVVILGAVFLLIGLILSGIAFGIGGVSAFTISTKDGQSITEKSVSFSETVDSIDLDMSVGDVTLHSYDGDEIRVDYYDSNQVEHKISCEDGVLTVRQTVAKKFTMDLFFLNDPDRKMDIYLPEGSSALKDGTFKMNTGSLKIPAEVSFATLNGNMDTGSFKMAGQGTDKKAEKLEVSNNTGSITVTDYAADSINLSATTGSIKLEKAEADDITLKDNTGSLTLTEVKAKDIEMRCSTGSIHLDQVEAENIKGKNNTGSIQGTLVGDYSYHATSDTGSVRVPESVEGAGKAEFDTDTGSIKIQKY